MSRPLKRSRKNFKYPPTGDARIDEAFEGVQKRFDEVGELTNPAVYRGNADLTQPGNLADIMNMLKRQQKRIEDLESLLRNFRVTGNAKLAKNRFGIVLDVPEVAAGEPYEYNGQFKVSVAPNESDPDDLDFTVSSGEIIASSRIYVPSSVTTVSPYTTVYIKMVLTYDAGYDTEVVIDTSQNWYLEEYDSKNAVAMLLAKYVPSTGVLEQIHLGGVLYVAGRLV